jgi:hypothetical protein
LLVAAPQTYAFYTHGTLRFASEQHLHNNGSGKLRESPELVTKHPQSEKQIFTTERGERVSLFFALGPGVFQANRPVENQFACRRILVAAKIAETLELIALRVRGFSQ